MFRTFLSVPFLPGIGFILDGRSKRQKRVQDLGDVDRLHRVSVVPADGDGHGPGQRHLPALGIQLQGPRQGTLAVLVSGR